MGEFLIAVVRIALFPFYRVKLYNVDFYNNSNKKYIICANHISNLDPVILMIKTKRRINFMAKKELFDIFLVKNVLKCVGAFPVDREKPGLSSIKKSLEILKNDDVLGIFPEGTRVKGYDENNAKPGVALIAHKAEAEVIPVYIKSTYKLFSRVEIVFGEPHNYFENIEGKVTSAHYSEVSKQILKDIYSLNKTLE